MTTDPLLVPSAPAVAALVRGLVESTWPTTEADRGAWFAEHHLDVEDVRHEAGAFSGVGPRAWGSPSCGWHVFEDEFVGLHWFLWEGRPWSDVLASATELRDLLSDVAGEPVDEPPRDRPAEGFTALWQVRGRTIHLYAHAPRSDVAAGRDVAVQLHVDHAARAAREDAVARAR